MPQLQQTQPLFRTTKNPISLAQLMPLMRITKRLERAHRVTSSSSLEFQLTGRQHSNAVLQNQPLRLNSWPHPLQAQNLSGGGESSNL
ncbi:hypothetical protein M501DRAFT_977514 [Patellaria atrata CBS 101060]|uniref:Uncharacterized protein n=1 Tax=Patellaria atrata CBS 101060 TaxID=1346257 RepID=A0A9P4S7G1_9PEZI|nr:hypothetical protein M501DRAFT_977514 [Patellaria atrata CBS 101060]